MIKLTVLTSVLQITVMILKNVSGLNNKEMLMDTLVKVPFHCPRNFNP